MADLEHVVQIDEGLQDQAVLGIPVPALRPPAVALGRGVDPGLDDVGRHQPRMQAVEAVHHLQDARGQGALDDRMLGPDSVLADGLEEVRLARDGPVLRGAHDGLQILKQRRPADHLLEAAQGDAPLEELADHLLGPRPRTLVALAIDGLAGGVHLRRPGFDIGDHLGLLAHRGVIGRDQLLVPPVVGEILEPGPELCPGRLKRRERFGRGPLGVHLGGQLDHPRIGRIQRLRPRQPRPCVRLALGDDQGFGQAGEEAKVVRMVGREALEQGNGRRERALLAQPLHLGPEGGLVHGGGRGIEVGGVHRLQVTPPATESPSGCAGGDPSATWARIQSRKATILGDRRRSFG